MAEITITSANFDEAVLKSDKPVLIDFWATWCGPCQMIAPIVHQIAEENDNVVVGKVDVDNEIALAQKFGISSIPTLVLMKNGQAVDTLVGLRSKEQILAFINQ
ncbi:MAG: thioredoxin [Clostridia bacterium]|nr:thioredoxin [Clostridia bacterium]